MRPSTTGRVAVAILAGALLSSCDYDDGRTLQPPTTVAPVEPGAERAYTTGSGTLDVIDPLTFTVTSCVRRVPGDDERPLSTLSVSGNGETPLHELFNITVAQTVSPADGTRTDTITAIFGPVEAPKRSWEAQVVVTDESGGGDGFLQIDDAGTSLRVRAVDAAFEQRGLGTAEGGPLGTGTLDLTCTT